MTNRPKEFDDRVMAYLPGLRRLAAKYVPRAYQDDLVTDTIMFALGKWQNFREDGGLWNWLAWNMRGIVTNGAVSARRRKAIATFVPIEDVANLATAPAQEGYVELSQALARLSSIKHGEVLIRRAMGDGLKEVAEERGLSRQRIQQLELAARADLVAA